MPRATQRALQNAKKATTNESAARRYTGFSVHNQVTVPPRDGRAIEALTGTQG